MQWNSRVGMYMNHIKLHETAMDIASFKTGVNQDETEEEQGVNNLLSNQLHL